jgi:signal transduction histidine kinase
MRGHLELLDHGDPGEIAETRDLLLDEVDRMSRLVGDLIVLAKTRRPDFLAPSEVDLGHLTPALLAKAKGLGSRDWQLDTTAEGTITVDEQRITQAVLQLADNAVKHTDPGDTIAIGSSIAGGTATFWVRDTGPGVPAAQREAIFERFGRGHVRPGDDGFGLGLSIVRAIAQAHGGTVSVTDAQPSGARFDLILPTEEVPPPWPRS